MKKFLIIAAAAGVVFSSCSGSKSVKTEEDSLAYVIGLELGNQLKQIDSTANLNIVIGAVKDAINNKPMMDRETAYNFARDYYTVRLPLKNSKKSAEFLAKVEKENSKVVKTESGLMYEIVTEGTGPKAVNNNDVVRVMYKGMLSDGKVFDSSYDRKDTAEFALDQVIKGWGEGMKLVGKGGKIKLWIPADLAYGDQAPPAVGPNQALLFEVELVDVKPTEQVPVAPEAPVAPAPAAPVKK